MAKRGGPSGGAGGGGMLALIAAVAISFYFINGYAASEGKDFGDMISKMWSGAFEEGERLSNDLKNELPNLNPGLDVKPDKPSKKQDSDASSSKQPSKGSSAAEALTVKGRAPKTGYSRDQFGPAWADVDRNGCDTRNDILKRDLKNVAYKPGSSCVVTSGKLNDPYTATTINFVRGQKTSTAVQIDHVVALSDAWQKGAQKWDDAKRKAFANDPLNLIAVDGPTNGKKSDKDAASWLPPNKDYRCAYVNRQVEVKTKYGVWVTDAEKTAMKTQLAKCA